MFVVTWSILGMGIKDGMGIPEVWWNLDLGEVLVGTGYNRLMDHLQEAVEG